MDNTHILVYAVVCHQGFVRDRNQDNFWCDGVFLECENNGFPNILTGEVDMAARPVFAVFDGLGGEVNGEQAAWLAARTLDDAITYRSMKEETEFMQEVFSSMNDSICSYANSHHIGHMGATAAVLGFADGAITMCNLGDSRVYLYRQGSLTRLSIDHTSNIILSGKPCLSQFLGIHEKEFRIEPALSVLEICSGDSYLLCSDGLTDMLSDEEIKTVLSISAMPSGAVELLLEKALNEGGKDNTTIIICTVNKE